MLYGTIRTFLKKAERERDKAMNVQELLSMLENPLVVQKLREVLQRTPLQDQATMVFQTPAAATTSPSENESQLRLRIDKLSRALEESREQILRLQEENDTLRGQLEQANHSIQEFLQSSF